MSFRLVAHYAKTLLIPEKISCLDSDLKTCVYCRNWLKEAT